MLFDHAADHVTVPSREPKPIGPSKKASAGRVIHARKPLGAASPTAKLTSPTKETTAAELGIRSFAVTYQRISGLGDAVQRIGNNSSISLSHGDGGPVFTSWTVTCRPTVGRSQCRAPDGCEARRLKGHSYCAPHLRLYAAPRIKPTGRMLVLSAAAHRKHKPQPPRLDLVLER